MKISIVTVAYNSAATISDTLRLVAKQTHPDVEHIVMDGASTDATMAIVQDNGNHISTLEHDAGIYDAMNKGLALARGDLVGFLNADDFLASQDVISEIARAASAPHVGAVCGDLVCVRNGRTDEVLRYWRCGEFSPSRLKFGWMPPHPTMRTGGASNRSLTALLNKSSEDLGVLRMNVVGGIMALLCKNARKQPQFYTLPR